MESSSSLESSTPLRSFLLHNNTPLPVSHVSSQESRKESLDASISSLSENERQIREKQFLLACERGDIGSVRKSLSTAKEEGLDINCVDPLGRSALLIAVENENIEMIELLLEENIETGDAILYAIEEENVEAVEIIIEHLEKIDKFRPETQGVEINEHSAFTPDITPIILAAHKDNFECYKLLYDKKATIPRPHDIDCDCEDCDSSRQDDSLRLSCSRLNAYRALTSPSHICLHASDPILYAFELSWELRRLSYIENEFRQEYQELSQKCQKFSVQMLDQVRGSKELEIILNYNTKTWEEVSTKSHHHLSETLARLKLAVKLRQKRFVAHPNCQQLLAGIWYEGLPIRNTNVLFKVFIFLGVALAFPIWSLIYLIAPTSTISSFIRKPFVKFLSHSGSYCFFLFLLILASQRMDRLDNMWGDVEEGDAGRKERRGPPPTIIELAILTWVFGLIWVEIKQLWDAGVKEYCHNLWNILDFITNSLYLCTFALRTVAYFQVEKEMITPGMSHIGRNLLRSKWDAWDPTLISECLFATANIFSSLKLVHIFTMNPHLGPLKISLGRMVIDIVKFFLVYCLVLFAFACGLNQLMWYYSAMRKKECETFIEKTHHLDNLYDIGREIRDLQDSCNPKYTSCASLYKSVETLFWSSFGIVELDTFDIDIEHVATQWTARTIFGAYCTICIIVLLNTLIAMMANSYMNIWVCASMIACSVPKCTSSSSSFILYLLNFPYVLFSLYHTVETLFWSMFGLIDLEHFSLREDHFLSEWTGKTIFGSYCCCSIIVLLNMLIAMMSNSYSYICNQADVEWKFARSKLWMEYFDDTATLPPPFNMIPSPKSFYYSIKWICDRLCRCSKTIQAGKQKSIRTQKILKIVKERENNYRRMLSKLTEKEELFMFVTRNLTKRYIAQTQRSKQQSVGVNEDDVNEIKQDISAFRYELLGILRNAGFQTGHTDMSQKSYSRNKKRCAMAERRMKKGLADFNIPVPETFQASRRTSVSTSETKLNAPFRLPQLNWRRLKKKVSFKQASYSPNTTSTNISPLATTSPSSLKASTRDQETFERPSYLKSKSFDVGHSHRLIEPPFNRTTTLFNDRPRLEKQMARIASDDTMLEIDADDDVL